MKILVRFFLIFLILTFFVATFFVIFTSDWLNQFFEKDIDEDEHCLNLPPRYYVHPVFLPSGPAIQADPQPLFFPNRTEKSAEVFCNLKNKTIIIVHSHVNNTKRRIYKRSILSKSWLDRNNAIMYFVVGHDENTDIDDEIKKYGDILQADVVENYHNISYKAILWITELGKCDEHPNIILKIDDDVQVDTVGVNFLIGRYQNLDDFIACRVLPNGQVVRNSSSKWYLSREEYKYSNLGTYCQGMAYLIAKNLLSVFNENLKKKTSQILWMDDWYVTRSLLGDHQISYYSLDQHVISTNSQKELLEVLSKPKTKYRQIFGHFRPSEKFPLYRQKHIWENVTKVNDSCDIMRKYRKNYAAYY